MITNLKHKIKNNKSLFKYIMILKNQKHRFTLKGRLNKNITGKGNEIISNQTTEFQNVKIRIKGNNNKIIIDDYCRFSNVTFFIQGDSNTIKISSNVSFKRGGSIWIEDCNCLIEIKSHTTFENVHLAATEPNSKIIIGKNCMFAYDIDLRTGDSHSIIDTITNKRINYAKDIQIADHVWLAAHCTILKGVSIAENSIVATGSIVTSSFKKEGVIIGGNPAKEIKENINWNRERIYDH
ncbi:MAG: acyltransferase [Cellulophaga sp.]